MGQLMFRKQRLTEKKKRLEKELTETENKDKKRQLENKIIELDKLIQPKIFWNSKEKKTFFKEQVEIERERLVALESLTLQQLRSQAKNKEVKGYSTMNKEELIKILKED